MKNVLIALIGLALLVGLFVWMKPPSPAVAITPPPGPSAQAPVAELAVEAAIPAPAPTQRVELVVKDKQLVSGPQVISVVQGTTVTLRITVDHHDELHLHGYDLTLKLPTAEAAELTFVADRSGRFEYELHHSHLTLGALEVQPQ